MKLGRRMPSARARKIIDEYTRRRALAAVSQGSIKRAFRFCGQFSDIQMRFHFCIIMPRLNTTRDIAHAARYHEDEYIFIVIVYAISLQSRSGHWLTKYSGRAGFQSARLHSNAHFIDADMMMGRYDAYLF